MSNFIDDIMDKRDTKTKEKKVRATKVDKATKVVKITKKEQQINDMARATVLPDYYKTVWTTSDLDELCTWLKQQDLVAIDTETLGLNPHKDEIVGISFYAPNQGYYIPIKHKDNVEGEHEGKVGRDFVQCLPKELISLQLKNILESSKIKPILHNCKFDRHVIYNWLGINIVPYYDTGIAQRLLDENVSSRLKDMAVMYLKVPADKFSTLFGNVTFDRVPVLMQGDRTGCLASYYAIKDTELTYKMYEFQMKYLNRPDLADIKHILFNIEMPVNDILFRAEQRGMLFDNDYMSNKVAPELKAKESILLSEIQSVLGNINLNSPAQLSVALYDKLQLPQVNKKAPRSTDKKTLVKLLSYNPVIEKLMEYRSLSKLISSFVDSLPNELIDGVVHPSFNSLGAVTSRMSCSNPNVQQMPSNVGGLIRNAFIARPGRILVSADFSGQEARWLAHVSKDPILLDIFISGKDFHAMTGTTVWNLMNTDHQITYDTFQRYREVYSVFRNKDGDVDESRVRDSDLIGKAVSDGILSTDDFDTVMKEASFGKKAEKFRKMAKTVNFGIIYGISEIGLSDQLRISEEEALTYIRAFHEAYPVASAWMDSVKSYIDKNHYVKTFVGSKRRLYPEMQSGQRWLFESAYRMGINAIIQGKN